MMAALAFDAPDCVSPSTATRDLASRQKSGEHELQSSAAVLVDASEYLVRFQPAHVSRVLARREPSLDADLVALAGPGRVVVNHGGREVMCHQHKSLCPLDLRDRC